MKFYMCQTASGLQLAPTQADAKALDPRFKEHHVPDEKAERMAYVNALLTQAYQGAELTAPTVPAIPAEVIEAPAPKHGPLTIVPDANRPLSEIDRILMRTGIEEQIWGMNADEIKKLNAVIQEREAELDKQAEKAKTTAPAPRVRVRAKA